MSATGRRQVRTAYCGWLDFVGVRGYTRSAAEGYRYLKIRWEQSLEGSSPSSGIDDLRHSQGCEKPRGACLGYLSYSERSLGLVSSGSKGMDQSVSRKSGRRQRTPRRPVDRSEPPPPGSHSASHLPRTSDTTGAGALKTVSEGRHSVSRMRVRK